MKNTEIEIGFYSFKQFGYFSLHIGGNGNSVKVFRLLYMYLFKYIKKQSLFWQCQETFHIYLDIGRDDGDDYNAGESSDEDYYE